MEQDEQQSMYDGIPSHGRYSNDSMSHGFISQMTRRLNNIDNESDHISFINKSFTALIKESTYPVVI